MAELTLTHGSLTAVINSQGAWLERLYDAHGPLLYPKTVKSAASGVQKVRGGCHVCLPNFGPGGDNGLKQHGFGRELPWNIDGQTQDSVLLTLTGMPAAYNRLTAQVQYRLHDAGVSMTLTADNNGSTDLRLSPGFHPYFYTATDDRVVVNGQTTGLQEIDPAQFLNYTPERLTVGGRDISLRATGLPQWVLWSDRLDDYVCLEPTQAGFSFERPGAAAELLAPGASWAWELHIEINKGD